MTRDQKLAVLLEMVIWEEQPEGSGQNNAALESPVQAATAAQQRGLISER
jgi:hypothetical protein